MNADNPDTPTDPDNPTSTHAPATPAAPATTPEVVKEPGAGLEEAVTCATQAARADALAIAELCQLAGQPQRIATFLAAGASEVQVRRALLGSRAESAEISSLIHPDALAKASNANFSLENNPLMKAVKKLTGKD